MKRYILLVEHEAVVREATAGMAELLGFHVINVGSADLALGVLNAVMIDVLLLGSLGDEDDRSILAGIARRTQSSIRVVVLHDPRSAHPVVPGSDASLARPFSIQQLGNVLRNTRS